ncbi:YqjD family protein [Rhodoferax sp. WC2427]|uniref:DUF883 family protein n=1 Tax=Rhodoferax sp. WC2427 TaxID=3234144 RepID=UPI003465BB63
MTASHHFKAVADSLVEDLADDVHNVLSIQELESQPQLKALRQRVEAKLAVARERAAEKGRIAAEKAKQAASSANAYAHAEPWKLATGALAAGVVLGWLLGRDRAD